MSRTSNLNKSHMAFRLLNLIWARFATASFNLRDQGDLAAALLFNKIWLYAEPESQWANWSIARLYAMTGDHSKAVSHIVAVVSRSKNFPKQRILNEPTFASLLEHPEIKKLTESEGKTISEH